MAKNNKRNHNFTFRADNLTEEEAYSLQEASINNKRELAPNARGTTIISEQGALPGSKDNKSLESGNS